MEKNNTSRLLLEMIAAPAFLVRDGIIVCANQAACQLPIAPGQAVSQLLGKDQQAYSEFTGGSLYLNLTAGELSLPASVTRTEDTDIFLLETDTPKLQVLALAAQQLRQDLQDLQIAAQMQPRNPQETQRRDGELKRSACRMQRILGNMSDAARLSELSTVPMEVTNLGELFDDLMEKLAPLCEKAGIILEYYPLNQAAVGLVNRDLICRAVYNLVSNAIKFSPRGSIMEARLTSRGNQVTFSLLDSGSGIDPRIPGNLYARYQRQPAIEDSRHGLGLGLTVVRSVAAAHGGTVLIDQPEGRGTRVTFTLELRKPESSSVRTPILLPKVDYSGGFDQALVELAEVLPSDAFFDL